MWIVTARTGQLTTAAQAFPRGRNRVPGNRMPQLEFLLPGMATQAKFIRRLMQHELMIGRMRLMTGDAAGSGNDAMDIRGWFFPAHQALLVTVTGDAHLKRPVRPELIAVVRRMGVVAKRTATKLEHAMHGLA